MSDSYEVRFAEDGEEKQIVDLLSSIFFEWKARGDKAIDHWYWMYKDNPIGPCNIVVSVYKDDVVGVAHDFHTYFKIGDDIRKTLYGTDVAVHLEHRRKGLHNRMTEFRKKHREGFGFHYGYSTNKILIDRSIRKRKEGDDPAFLFPVDINRYLLVHDVDLHLEKKEVDQAWIKKQGYIIQQLSSKVRSSFFGSMRENGDLEIITNENFDDVEAFWDTIKSKYDVITKKDQQYLRWRFCDKRAGEYYIFSARMNGVFYGYVVASIDHENPTYPMGNIIDFLTLGDSGRDLYLLQESLNYLSEMGINAFNVYAVKGSHMSQLLMSMGFIDRGDTMYTTYKIPDLPGEPHPVIEVSNENKIHLMYSDFYVK